MTVAPTPEAWDAEAEIVIIGDMLDSSLAALNEDQQLAKVPEGLAV
ncbi:MAG: hypothetical protein AAF439_13330 [Pseudomonadota bacterium]